MKMNRSKVIRKLIALVLTLGMVVSAVVPQTLTAHAARIDLSIMDVNVHEERLEVRFWLEYAQYINIAVFYVDGFDEIENRPIRGDRIGYIIKDYFANGSTTLNPMAYDPCPVREPHTPSHHAHPGRASWYGVQEVYRNASCPFDESVGSPRWPHYAS